MSNNLTVVSTQNSAVAVSSHMVDHQTAALIRNEIQSQRIVDLSAQAFAQVCEQLRGALKAAIEENTALKSRVIVEETALKELRILHAANQNADQQKMLNASAEIVAQSKQYQDLNAAVEAQNKTVSALRSTNTALQQQVNSLTATQKSLNDQIKSLKTKYPEISS